MTRKLLWAVTGLVLAGITGIAIVTAGPSQVLRSLQVIRRSLKTRSQKLEFDGWSNNESSVMDDT